MRLVYAQERMRDAVRALAANEGDVRNGLYAAHRQLFTVKAADLPAGELRREFQDIHDRLTRRDLSDAHESGVLEIIADLAPDEAAAVAGRIRDLDERVSLLVPARFDSSPPMDAEAPAHGEPRHSLAVRRSNAVLIVFGSTEGHTRRLAEFLGERLAQAGREIVLRPAPETKGAFDPTGYGLVVVAASLHWGRYQSAVIDFVQRHHQTLNAAPSAFVSVSLAAAGVDQPENVSLEECLAQFLEETSWKPHALHHAAGAIRHSAYDYFKSLAAKLIADDRRDKVTPAEDYDLTDYDALSAFALGLAGEVTASPAP